MKPLRHLTVLAAVAALATAGCSASAGQPPAVPSPSADHHHHAGHPAPDASGAPGRPAGRIVVHAADSLAGVFTQLADKFEEAYPGTEVVFEFGPAATHAQHIIEGANIDIFASADPSATKQVTDSGATTGRPTVIARNPLVIAVSKANPAAVHGIEDLERSAVRVALCAQQAPCGVAAQRILDASSVTVRQATIEPDAQTALAKVQAGTVDAALVYRTDIVAAGADVNAIDFQPATKVADEYSVVIVKSGGNQTGANAFVGFVCSSLARRIYAEAGFSPA